MIQNVFDYFENLDKKKLPRKKQNLIYDNEHIKNVPTMTESGILTHPLHIDGTHYYVKGNNGECSVVDIASTNMYNSIGIPTPPIYTIEKPASGCQPYPLISLATQDVTSVNDLLFTIANDMMSQQAVRNFRLYTLHKWDPLYDSDIRRLFLKYMTKECFEQLVALFLVDELRSEQDRHEENYFFYKSPGSDKFEGIMPIDNEMMHVLRFDMQSKLQFDTFLISPYTTPNMLGSLDYNCYRNRINDIKELLQDGVLTPNQIALMKRAIGYNLPKEVKKVGKNHHFKSYRQSAYDATARLWDYHQKDLGRELNL